MITVCSEDVVDVWAQTPFADVFDSEVFSCSCGSRKPDPRLYLQACEELDVEPAWPGVRDWPGPRITKIPEVLELV